jgi:hypothetical protein
MDEKLLDIERSIGLTIHCVQNKTEKNIAAGGIPFTQGETQEGRSGIGE